MYSRITVGEEQVEGENKQTNPFSEVRNIFIYVFLYCDRMNKKDK